MPYQHTSHAESQARREAIAAALDSPDVNAYTITPRTEDSTDDDDAAFDVLAGTVEQAAERAAHMMYGNEVTARRTTGDRGNTGYFRAYRDVSDSGGWKRAAVGRPFHVG